MSVCLLGVRLRNGRGVERALVGLALVPLVLAATDGEAKEFRISIIKPKERKREAVGVGGKGGSEDQPEIEGSKDAKELLVDKGWDPAMGARPLRRAIQRYIEDPLADEVLKAGSMTPGSTVQVDRDAKGDEQDHPLKLKIVKPRKKPAKKAEPEKVGVGAKKDGDDSSDGDEPESSGSDDGK